MNLKIVSFNIRGHNDPNGNSIIERAPRLYKTITPIDPDIIGFQEFCPKWKEHIEKFFGSNYHIFNKYRCETEDIEGCPILWKKEKFKCQKTGYFWLSDTPEIQSRGWDEVYNCYRLCQYVVLKDLSSGNMVTVMNTHFGFGDKGQIKSVNLIYDYCKKISNHPTIIMGDFNMTPKSKPYKKMSSLFIDTNPLKEKDFCATYHGYNPNGENNQHIDYCFVNQAAQTNQKIIDTKIEGKFPSDHFGLEININIE